MTATNPLPKAIHAAWCELTTPEAHAWYKAKASQAQATATFASTIAHKCFTTIKQWLKPRTEQVLLVDLDDEPTELRSAVEDADSGRVTALEELAIALDQEPTSEALNDDDPSELRPVLGEAIVQTEDSLEDADDLTEGEEDMYLQSWAEEEPLNEEVDMYSDSEIDSTEESANERVHA